MIRNTILFLLLIWGTFSISCEKVDGVYCLSKELKKEDQLFFNDLISVEILAKQKEWASAALKAMELKSCASIQDVFIEKDVPLAMALDVATVVYLFSANSEDMKILWKTEEALKKYSAQFCGKRNFFYSELLRLKMAFLWRQGNKLGHDKALNELVLYDVDDQGALLTLMAAYRERKDNFQNIKDFPAAYIANGGASNILWQTADIFFSDISGDDKWNRGNEWLGRNLSANVDELRNHLDFIADMLDSNKPERSFAYCIILLDFMEKLSKKEYDINVMSVAMSEYYRVISLMTN